MSRRIAIIGAGPGGLATAMLLAQAGADVTVFEKSHRVGGRSAGIDAQTAAGRFRFDMGPTFFLYPRVLDDIFAACGREMKREIDLIKLDPQYDLMFESGGHIRATPDLARLQAEVAKLSPHDAAALPRFMADNRAKLSAFRPILEAAFHGWRDLVRPDMLKALPMMRPWRTVDSDLATYFKDERVRLAFSFQSKYLGMSPYRCPSLFTILSFMEYEFGVYHPRGGCGAVMETLARVAGEMGVTVPAGRAGAGNAVFRQAGERRAHRPRRLQGRCGGGERRFCRAPCKAWCRTPCAAAGPTANWRRRNFPAPPSCSISGLEGVEEKLAHHTIYLSAEYKRNIAEIEAGAAPPADPSFYVQNACVTDPALAPPGHSHALCAGARRQPHRCGDRLAGHAGEVPCDDASSGSAGSACTNVEKRIVFEKMLTPQGWENEHAVHRGATFNLSHSLDQMLCFRPRNRFEDLDGVYLVGGGTHPGSGLPVIFEGARITSRLLADDLGLSRALGTASRRWRRPISRPFWRRRCERFRTEHCTARSRWSAAAWPDLRAPARWRRAGHRVVLFEKNEWLGGKAALFEQDGFRFDMGPTILTVPRVLERIFAEAGVRMQDRLDLRRIDPQWRCFFDDGSVLDLQAGCAGHGRDAWRHDAPGSQAGYADFHRHVGKAARGEREILLLAIGRRHPRYARHEKESRSGHAARCAEPAHGKHGGRRDTQTGEGQAGGPDAGPFRAICRLLSLWTRRRFCAASRICKPMMACGIPWAAHVRCRWRWKSSGGSWVWSYRTGTGHQPHPCAGMAR